MKTIEKKLQDIGCKYEVTAFGNNYFWNVPPVSFPGITIAFGPKDNDMKTFKSVEHYCRRAGYSFESFGGIPGYSVFTIMFEADREILKTYSHFTKKSNDACIKTIHTFCELEKDTGNELNEVLHGIMEFYGEELIESFKSIQEQAS